MGQQAVFTHPNIKVGFHFEQHNGFQTLHKNPDEITMGEPERFTFSRQGKTLRITHKASHQVRIISGKQFTAECQVLVCQLARSVVVCLLKPGVLVPDDSPCHLQVSGRKMEDLKILDIMTGVSDHHFIARIVCTNVRGFFHQKYSVGMKNLTIEER